MGELILRRLKVEDEKAFHAALAEWDHSFIFARDFSSELPFADYVELLASFERGENLQAGYVPDSLFFGFVDGVIVGRLGLRHCLNDFLLGVGGHIGYGVVPRFRRHGYAREMLRLSLPFARTLGLSRVLLTCDDDNVGSLKTIVGCGGVLENVVFVAEGAPLKRRYWIEVPS